MRDNKNITKLVEDYSAWIKLNIPKSYAENNDRDLSADAILWDSCELKLNHDQKKWLREFITKWEKAYL
jgi:hypothetical protein